MSDLFSDPGRLPNRRGIWCPICDEPIPSIDTQYLSCEHLVGFEICGVDADVWASFASQSLIDTLTAAGKVLHGLSPSDQAWFQDLVESHAILRRVALPPIFFGATLEERIVYRTCLAMLDEFEGIEYRSFSPSMAWSLLCWFSPEPELLVQRTAISQSLIEEDVKEIMSIVTSSCEPDM